MKIVNNHNIIQFLDSVSGLGKNVYWETNKNNKYLPD